MKKLFFAVAIMLVSVTGLFAQNAPIPNDPELRMGVLDNGLTYYIRHNAKPEKQAEFFIFHNVGAMQEEDSQQGLAHFLEHMAFNGTKNFPGKGLINWLETIGVKFGQNLNAGTSTELTVYMMQSVPMVRESVIDSALLILHDWSYFITLDPKEIDNERGVILEELRTRNDANWRITEKSANYLYGDTKYAKRNVIGHEEGLKTFAHQELVDFYHRWYRTDQQAIIVVGDFDVDMMEQKVKAIMADIPAVENPEQKEWIDLPENEEPVVGVVTDPELGGTSVSVYIKRPATPREINNTVMASIMNLMDMYINTISSERMRDVAQKPGAPFTNASIRASRSMTNTAEATLGSAGAREGEVLKAFEALYTEMERIARFGFTESEFERAKAEIDRQIQKDYDERDDRRSQDFVWRYIYNFKDNWAVPSAEMEYEMDKQLMQMISLDMLNNFTKSARFTPENQVVIVTMPEKAGVHIPTEAEVTAIIEKVRNAELEALTEDVVSEPLIPADVKLKGSKVSKTAADKFGATVWTLKNGVKVVVKPTDLKNDQILMDVTSKGGKSVLADDEILTADNLASYIQQAGVGKFSAPELRKQLSGKMASVRPGISSYENGFTGSASPKDIETLMQLTYLYFTAPRFSQDDFNVMIDRLKAAYANIESNPMFALQRELTATLYGNSPRREVLTPDKIDEIDFTKMPAIYEKLYSNADDFTFTFVGNVDMDTFKPLVEKYLGSLPKTKKSFTWKDDGVRVQKGQIENRFTTPMQQRKTTVFYVFSGSMEYNLENDLALSFLKQALDMRYLESVREEKGGTYGVSVGSNLSYSPVDEYLLQIMFDTNPEMADELMEIIMDEIREVAQNGVRAEDLAKIKEYYAKQYPDDTKQNTYWRGIISEYHVKGYDMDNNFMNIVNGFTPEYFKAVAAKILEDNNRILLVMNPEE